MSALPTIVQDEEPNINVRPMLTTAHATDLFLGDLTRRGYSVRTITTYRRILDKLCDRLPDDQDVSKITVDDCRRFLNGWNGKAAGTRSHTFAVLSSFFGYLYVTEKIRRNPLDRLERPKRIPAEDLDVTTVSTGDVRKLLTAAESWPEKLAIGILVYMGPRRHAAALLRLADYDRDRRRLRFREKGAKVIWKPVPVELARLLDSAIASGAIVEGGYLIPNEAPTTRRGDRDDRIIWRLVKKVADRAGVEAHVHALRASFAVFYLEQNPGAIESLKELMGHRSLITTQGYLRRLDRGAAMESVRSLNWEIPPQPDLVEALAPTLRITSGARSEETVEPGSVVYFIAAGDPNLGDGTPVKIGLAGDPVRRLQAFQVVHDRPLFLVATTPGDMKRERELHLRFAEDRIRGEWFLASDAIRRFVAQIDKHAVPIGNETAVNHFASNALMGAGGFEPPNPDSVGAGTAGRKRGPKGAS